MISHSLELSLNFAVSIAKKYQHEYISVEHILYALLENPEAKQALEGCGCPLATVKGDLEHFFTQRLEANLLPKQSPQPTLAFQRVLQNAAQHIIASGNDKIFGDSVLVALFLEKESFAAYFLQKRGITRVKLIRFISHGLDEDMYESEPESIEPEGIEPTSTPEKVSEQNNPKKDALSSFAVNLCDKAREGLIDPLIGRQDEVERIVQILCRRRKNNPLLVGESGVGKTAVVEGLARNIVDQKVPQVLSQVEIFALEMGSLLAGTKFRGDFEQRLKNVVKQLKKKKSAILFIDEIHTIMGAGAVSGGSLDASNILKPFLSSGEIRCIGSTTFKEFRQHIEQDHALSRRFQKIAIEEPTVSDTIKILQGLKLTYESFHNVHYSSDAIKAAAELSHKHIKDRKLPDKAIDILDEAGAFFAAKENSERNKKKQHIGVAEIKKIISKIARIPSDRLSSSDKHQLKNLENQLKSSIFGQDEAIASVTKAIRTARAGLGHDHKPIGSFLFSGPTGVGKTELAKQVSHLLGISFIRIDMSEYMEKHAVSRLIGAPPGYVGYEEGGILTDAIHKQPHSVLLLDEIEKAHKDVHNILLQIMDHGTLTDSNGRETDFRNVVIILTTNVGAEDITRKSIGFSDDLKDMSKDTTAIKQAFTPEFRNRLDAIISFNVLPEHVMLQIVEKFLLELEPKLKAKRVKWSVDQEVKQYLAQKGYTPAYGARPLARVIQDEITIPLSESLLYGKLSKGGKVQIKYSKSDGLQFIY